MQSSSPLFLAIIAWILSNPSYSREFSDSEMSDRSDEEEDVDGEEEDVEPDYAEDEEVESDLEIEAGGEEDAASISSGSVLSQAIQLPVPPAREPDEDEPPAKMKKWCRCSRLATAGDWNEDLLDLYLGEKMHDCTFKVGTNEIGLKIFRCHRLILAQSSEVFQAMLYGAFTEAKKGPENEIVMETVSPAAFDAAMKFVYGKQEEFNNLAHTLEVLQFAHKYDIVKLLQVAQAACWKFELEAIDFLKMHCIFEKLHLKNSASRAMKYIKNHCGEIIRSESWKHVDEDVVRTILEQPELNIRSELDLIDALVTWGQNTTIEAEGTTLREKVGGLLPLIRFLSMEPGELARVSEELLLTDAERSSILSSKILKQVDLMPPDFSRCEVSRALYQNPELLGFTDFEAVEAISKDVAPLHFHITDDAYLLAVEIYSIGHINKYKYVDLTVRVMQDDRLCGFGNSNQSDKDGYVVLNWPTLLEKGVDYSIIVDYPDENQVCAKIKVFEEVHSYKNFSVDLSRGEWEFKDVTSLLLGTPTK